MGSHFGPRNWTYFWAPQNHPLLDFKPPESGQSLAQKLDMSMVPKKESLEPGMDPKAFAAPEKWNSC